MARAPLALALVFGLLLNGGTALGQGSGDFSDAERAALARGELVERPSPEEVAGHRYVGGSSYRAIERPMPEVWRALHDVARFDHMLPQTREVRIVRTSARETIARVEHSYGPASAAYHLRLRWSERPRRLSFDLDPSRPHDIEAAHGFCEVSRFPGDARRTLVTWAARADPGGSILFEPFRPEIQRWLLRVPSTMRTWLTGEAASLYVD